MLANYLPIFVFSIFPPNIYFFLSLIGVVLLIMSDTEFNGDKEERHRDRMQRKKSIVDKEIETATQERGVLLVNTGNGKGKSSSAFGMLARALGHDMKVGVVQFIKGTFSTGEEAFFRRYPKIDYYVMGEGYTWETQNLERDIKTAEDAWNKAYAMLSNDKYQLVVLDELNIALKYKYISLEKVLNALLARPAMQHVVVTGRAAPTELIDIADTVTEMREIKHAYKNGIKAQKGVEL